MAGLDYRMFACRICIPASSLALTLVIAAHATALIILSYVLHDIFVVDNSICEGISKGTGRSGTYNVARDKVVNPTKDGVGETSLVDKSATVADIHGQGQTSIATAVRGLTFLSCPLICPADCRNAAFVTQ